MKDATHTQQNAANPDHSVWLCAHAGTGKTKVLVERVLRLLLQGCAPSSILAITYTRAAAAEMQARIRKRLAEWSTMQEDALAESLEALLGEPSSPEQRVAAKQLFETLLTDARGLSIETIHGFCQSLLQRFPVEAGFVSAPTIVEEREHWQMIHQAVERMWQHAGRDTATAEALHALAVKLSDATLKEVIDALIKEHRLLFALWHDDESRQAYGKALYEYLGLPPHIDEAALLQRQLATQPLDNEQLPAIISWLQAGLKTDQTNAHYLQQWAQALQQNDITCDALNQMCLAFCKQEKGRAKPEPKAKLATDKCAESRPDLLQLLQEQQEWALETMHLLNARDVAQHNVTLSQIGQAVLLHYRSIKSEANVIDYDDVIHAAQTLLSKSGICEWILLKLDRELQHILIDEAQDTSPEQWRLTRLLVEELFTPELYETSPRTLFVVGDKKQSIYRFQGADPDGFRNYENYYQHWFEQSGQAFVQLALETSFRSGEPVLKVVDAVCAITEVKQALADGKVSHQVHRRGMAGRVECWPLIKKQEVPEANAWKIPPVRQSAATSRARQAKQVADQVAEWIRDERLLPAKGRPIQPGDILILVQRRNALMHHLVSELQLRGVAVAGVDRIKLSEHLAVQDILAMAEWCLLPADDLVLATILKGPYVELPEERLFELAHNRGEQTLWQRVQESEPDIASKLQAVQYQSRTLLPYDWLQWLLHEADMQAMLARYFGAEIDELCHELSEQALHYEAQPGASLQGFIAWLLEADLQIKRDIPQHANAVRIMTVHGAKGLQAPIVILPDATDGPVDKTTLLIDRLGESAVVYSMPPYTPRPPRLQQRKDAMRSDEAAEYFRLLYVAMTRAEDELYIGGYEMKKSKSLQSWYEVVRAAMQTLGAEEQDGALVVSSQQQEAVPAEPAEPKAEAVALPSWWQSKAKPEQASAPMTPSHAEEKPAANAAKAQDQAEGMDQRERGIVTHRLLQVVAGNMSAPSIDALQAMTQWMQPSIADRYASEIAQEVQAVLQDDALKWLWQPHLQTEPSLQGVLLRNDRRQTVRAQMDALLVNEHDVHIIDYKTDRAVPARPDEISPAYIAQLSLYHQLVTMLYPTHEVQCWLLYTAGPTLHHVNKAFPQPMPLDSRTA